MSMKRFRVAEDSMLPTLRPGDEFLATSTVTPELGDIISFPHPARDDFWLVKRVAEPPEPIDEGHVWVLSDNHEMTHADSRTLGQIDVTTAMTAVTHLNATTFVEGCELLCGEDDALARAVELFGVPEFWHREPGFQCLVLLILEQQVSLESGAAVYRRLDQASGGIAPESLVRLGVDGMRSIGTTRQKAGYLMTLSEMSIDGRFDVDALADDTPARAREKLLEISGIGPWTADAYLLSALRIPDMWPVGDRALQVGASEVLGLSKIPTEAELEVLAEPWRPARSVAARIIWHSYLSARGRVEPPDPTQHSKPEST